MIEVGASNFLLSPALGCFVVQEQKNTTLSTRWRARLLDRVNVATATSVILSLILSIYFIVKSEIVVQHRRAFILFDDAAISLVYARNFATGHGLAWTYGQHPVEGYTNFLWTLWMSFLELTHVSDRMIGLLVMMSGAALLALNTFLVTRIAFIISKGSFVAVAITGAFTATFFGLAFWTLQGMETGLVACAYSAAVLIVLHLRDVGVAQRTTWWWVGLGITFGAAGLTRDDCLVIVAVIAIYAWATLRPTLRQTFLVALPAGIAILGHEIWRIAYYHHPFPNTYYLKLYKIPLGTRFFRGYLTITQNLTLQYIVPVALILVFLVVSRHSRTKLPVGFPLLGTIVAAQMAYVFYVGGDTYESTFWDRYLVPVAPLLIIAAVVSASGLVQKKENARWNFGAVAIIVAFGTLINWWSVIPTWQIQVGPNFQSETSAWVAVNLACAGSLLILGIAVSGGLASATRGTMVAGIAIIVALGAVPWFDFHKSGSEEIPLDRIVSLIGVAMRYATPSNATIAYVSVGNQTYFSHRAVIDLLGYTDHYVATTAPHTEAYFLPGHNKWDYEYSIHKLRPKVVEDLFQPTPQDIRNMTTWGYQSQYFAYVGTIYWLPGWFNPKAFSRNFGKIDPPRHEYARHF